MATDAPDNKMLCYCRNVDYGTVRKCIAENNASRIAEVMTGCTAGTGCRTCHPEIQELLDAHREQNAGFFKRLLRKILARG